MIIAISYGDDNFSQSLNYNMRTAKKYGKADVTIAYGPSDIEKDFKKKHNEIFQCIKGAGYWLWKPYIINKTLEEVEDGDYVVYSDSGTFYRQNIALYINAMKQKNTSVYVGEVNYLEKEYSKRDAFVYIGVDDMQFENTMQYDAAFLIVKKTKFTVKIIKEWLDYSCDIRIISDNENVCGLNDYDGFVQNRYDQTVMSLVFKKNGIFPMKNASQPDWRFTCIEPLIIVGKGKYISKLKYHNKEVCEKWINETYIPPLIVRTRFRNMNYFKFQVKIIFKIVKYIYRNKVSYVLTKLYIKRKKRGVVHEK